MIFLQSETKCKPYQNDWITIRYFYIIWRAYFKTEWKFRYVFHALAILINLIPLFVFYIWAFEILPFNLNHGYYENLIGHTFEGGVIILSGVKYEILSLSFNSTQHRRCVPFVENKKKCIKLHRSGLFFPRWSANINIRSHIKLIE
jgi:hypothetical protein